ncbi:AAA domain-containing protein [Desulfobacca acetoxidans]|uniref:AAA domain-containing protein n=1 Tax=Desulfobacca acetoxidans TaxID=60893 RepID=UPI0002F3A9D7|nr:AAA domain-containing protein [Desulfobacca acetoxidans]
MEQSAAGEIDPWDRELIEPFLKQFAHALHPNGEIDLDKLIANPSDRPGNPLVTNAPVLFIRRGRGRLWEQEFKSIIASLEQGYEIPPTLRPLVEEEPTVVNEETRYGWRSLGENLLFPLPYNEEQKEIVRRLAVHNGVVVQGPPGTGKSHTIVNLICHLLSHGKRVLITSQGERALRVLGEMIAEKLKEIKPLCVSVLGSDKRSADEMEQAVTQISERLASLDRDSLERKIHSLNQILGDIRERVARFKNQIKLMAEREQETFEIDDRKLTPLQVSRWLGENQDHNWLPDPLPPDCQPPLSSEEISRLFRLQGMLRREDLKALALQRPSLDSLPTPFDLQTLFDNLDEAEKELADLQEQESKWTEVLKELALKRPDPAKVPGFAELENYFHQLTELKKQIDILKSLKEELKRLNLDREKANDLMDISRKSLDILHRAESWMQMVITDAFAGEDQKNYWKRFYSDCSNKLQDILELEHRLSEHNILLPDGITLPKLIDHLQYYKTILLTSNYVKKFFHKLFLKKHQMIINQITVDGNISSDLKDIELVIEYIQCQEHLNRLVTKWNNVIGSIVGELASSEHPRLSNWFRSNLDWINLILEWAESVSNRLPAVLGSSVILTFEDCAHLDCWGELKQLAMWNMANFDLEDLEKRYTGFSNYLEEGANEVERANGTIVVCKKCGSKNSINPEYIKKTGAWSCGKCKVILEIYHQIWKHLFRSFVERDLHGWRENYEHLLYLEQKQIEFDNFKSLKHATQERLEEIKATYLNLINSMEKGISDLFSHESYRKISLALKYKEIESYKAAYAELKRLVELEPLSQEHAQLSDRLAKLTPCWVSHIAQQGGAGNPLNSPVDWQLAWTLKRAECWLIKLEQEMNPEELQKEIEVLNNQEKRLIEELVAQNTWLRQIDRIKENQRRSLTAWLHIVKNKIGKGTGKYAPYWRLQARKEMVVCQEAIPVWIMPLYRVIENLQVPQAKFDVVIVDESSQCDLFSLSALFRGQKAVIVGDHNQISPTIIGAIGSDVIQIKERFLQDIPQKALFEPRTSLYDMSRLIFPGQLMLKEHFRCVPEIIQFSNYQFYGGEITPLRMPQESERLDPSIVNVFVPEGYLAESTAKINEPEAKALVDKLVELCANPQYSGKTMGVISLLGEDQAQLIEQMIRDNLDEREIINRRIICGDAYAFQGDERHVIFLSLVAATNQRFRALTQTADKQRFNVAASRAKDQVWLFHSIDLKDIGNSECMRFQLLNYFLQPHISAPSAQEVESLFESEFEREVYRLIKSRGYAVRPQIKVGHHRIDMVVYGINNRLAVECDGDKWHGPEKWEEDRERQGILERAGWNFWRIRGSMFYRNREQALESLWTKLSEMNISPL